MGSGLLTFMCDHDGVQLDGLIALPDGEGPFAAVLVMHNALGMGPQVRETAVKLSELGYAAIVTDMYGGGAAAGLPLQEAGAAYARLREAPDLLRARAVHWFETVASHSKIDADHVSAIGYCFGGQCVLELARSGAHVRLVSSFHGILTTHAPAERGAVKARVLAWCGGQDPYASAADIEALRRELESAQADHEVIVFGSAQHNFTDPNAHALNMAGIAYDAHAHQKSWEGTVKALAEAT